MSQTTFSEEFKQEAVRRSYSSGKSVRAVAEELKLSVNTLYDWRRRLGHLWKTQASKSPAASEESEEMRSLRRENEMLRQERDILKKAIGYFTQPPQK